MAVSSTTGGLKTGVCLSTDRPDNPYAGQVIFESDTGKVYVWAGSTWVNIGDTSGEGVQLPSGTTAERPASPTAGQMRFNETTGEPEWYSSALGLWVNFRNAPIIEIAYLVIAGGGGGGVDVGNGGGTGGGGAGGYRNSYAAESSGGGATTESLLSVDPNTNYSVTVGAGGSSMTKGVDSSFHTITTVGGGFGGAYSASVNGGSGGSGGGANYGATGGSGTANQGYDGGSSSYAAPYNGAGGGGAGAAGTAGGNPVGTGGAGLYSSITGSSVPRGGGGGGGAPGGTGGSGGVGGGGTGAGSSSNPSAGSNNTGGGGGGAGVSTTTLSGANGGSGIVILRYPGGLTPTVSAGLTSTTTTVGADKVTVFTAGTGTVSWA